MKRLLSLLIMLSMFAMPMANAYSVDSDWYWSSYYSEIEWMMANGVMTGDNTDTFRPDDCVNRAEFTKVLYSMTGGVQTLDQVFSDVEVEDWFAPYVATAAEEGIVSGYEDGTFRPAQCVTRAEGVKMAMVAYESMLPDLDAYSYSYYDDITEEDWFFDYFSDGFSLGVVPTSHVVWIEGEADVTYEPHEEMSREEVASLFYRLQTVVDNDLSYYDWWSSPDPRVDLFTKACSIEKSEVVKGVPLEWGMIKDADALMRIDGENRGQLRQFAMHIDEIGGGEVWSTVIDQYNWSVMDEISYEKFGEQIIMDDWQLGLTVRDLGPDEYADVAIAARVDQFNEFQKVIATLIWESYGADVECEAYETYTMWTVEWAELYVLRYGDLFIFANTEELRAEFLEQVLAGEGHDEIKVDALLYGWMDFENTTSFFDDNFYTDVTRIIDLGVEEVEFTLEALSDGFKFTSDLTLDDGSELIETYEDEYLELVDRVPAGDLLMYMEDQDLSLVLEDVASYFLYEEDAYEWLASEVNFEAETLQLLAESGYAMTIADSGNVIPDTAFYLHLTHRDEKAMAPDLTAELDEFFASIATETYYTMDDEIEIEYLVQEEAMSDTMSKWSLNVEEIAGASGNEFFADESYEIHYGLVEDDVYVIAFYDGFDEAWGGKSVEDYRRFELASEEVDHLASQVQFIDFSGVGDLVESYGELVDDEYSVRDFNMVSAWLDQMGWLYSATYMKSDDVLRQSIFWSI